MPLNVTSLMASNFGLITHPQTQFFSFPNKTDFMSDDDSWEVRAFEEDTTGNALGCTWPPRSYSCTFCRREFRSAQALGGHMNVHRRDRARLHDAPPPSPAALVIPTVLSNGLCFVYPLPKPNPNPSPILFPSPPINYAFPNKPNETAANSVVSSVCQSEPSPSNSLDNNYQDKGKDFGVEEELDLELRLGRRGAP